MFVTRFSMPNRQRSSRRSASGNKSLPSACHCKMSFSVMNTRSAVSLWDIVSVSQSCTGEGLNAGYGSGVTRNRTVNTTI